MELLLECLDHKLPTLVDNQFKNINSGGCGVFAHVLATELQEVLGVTASVAWLDTCDANTVSEALNTVRNNNGNHFDLEDMNAYGVWCNHVMLKVNNHLIDSTGVYENLGDTRWLMLTMSEVIDLNTLGVLANNPNGWNRSFDRGQIPHIIG